MIHLSSKESNVKCSMSIKSASQALVSIVSCCAWCYCISMIRPVSKSVCKYASKGIVISKKTKHIYGMQQQYNNEQQYIIMKLFKRNKGINDTLRSIITIVLLLLIIVNPTYDNINNNNNNNHNNKNDRYFFALGLSTVIPTILKDSSINDRTLKVTFVTGNAMKARELENIVEEHCYNNNNNLDNDDTDTLQDALIQKFDDTNLKFIPMKEYMDDIDDTECCSLLQLDISVLSIHLPEIQEVDTIAIAKQKAILASQLVNGACVVEDTSLEFTALGGMPGPYIKWFQDTLKSEGLYNILAAYNDKSATAKCTLAYIPSPYSDPVLFTGECHGTIVAPIKNGTQYGFGWDSIFIPNGYHETFSQMNMEDKNRISHRGHAVRQWADWLGQNQDVLLQRQYNTKSSPSTTTVLGHQGLSFSLRPKK